MHLQKLFEKVIPLVEHSSSTEESQHSLTLQGEYYESFIKDLNVLHSFLQEFRCDENLRLKINDGETVSIEELNELLESNISKWRVILAKNLDNLYEGLKGKIIFFFSLKGFERFVEELNPFGQKSILNTTENIVIIVKGIETFAFGPKLFIGDLGKEASFDNSNNNFPTSQKILETIHFISNEDVVIAPSNSVLTNGDISSRLLREFIKKSIQVLAACLINEYYSNKKVVLKGIKRIETSLNTDELNEDKSLPELQSQLIEAVNWVYEERTDTRLKLLLDRITLDFDEKKSYLNNLFNHLSKALKQAKEQYNFVILDRKDQYLKEVRELLKDLKTQSELYSTKIRSILSNWLRDVLAALASIVFTTFSKSGEISIVKYNGSLDFILKALSIYYVISVILQVLIDWRDIAVSQKELKYWKDVTRAYIPVVEFEAHLKDALTARKKMACLFRIIIILLYIIIAVVCWNYPPIREYLTK